MVRILAATLLCAAMASAQTTVIRLGTLVPKGSSWHKILITMGDEWSKASNGKIELKIYPGGEQGDEPEMVDKVRIKKLQAVALSGAGLTGIDAGVAALQIPMMLNNYEELDYIRDKIAPRLEKEFLAKGFVVLNWGDAGWVHFFTKQPASSPDDIRKMKLCVLQGDNSTMRLYQLNGFHPVALAATDILPGLQTGLVDAIQSPPLLALANQWFGGAKNMLDIKFTSLVGATLIRKDVWDSIPKDVQEKMRESARVAGIGLREEIRKTEAQSVPLMRQFGLNVVHADDKTVAEWRALCEAIYPKLRGPYIPADLFDQVVKLRDEYRKAHPEPKS
ncbi:MAG TPA: TRAP transporter substrate-binding protein DctP [Bryobacteraceae bacterium]|jgi:TRAP-type C4-dicarboxylate transport system substrate-binding protein|nr:TRAP transporter substrate-binding protein DctP [Bryobacteraceae bacterium]